MPAATATPRAAFWETVTRFETAKMAPWLGLRNALGVTLALAGGIASGNPGGGLLTAIGALNVSYSDGSDPYLHRARRMLAAGLFCAIAVFLGGLAGEHHTASIVIATLIAFIAGLMSAVAGPSSDVAILSLVTFVVFSTQSMTPKRAAISGALALGGSLLQMLLSLALWPVRRYAPERHALGELFNELGNAAASTTPATEAPPASFQTTNAQNALASLSGDRSVEASRWLALLSQAERIRLALLALARLEIRLGRDAGCAHEQFVVADARQLASRMLHAIAAGLTSGDPIAAPEGCLEQLAARSESLRVPDCSGLAREARSQMEALAGQLRSSAELATHATPKGVAGFLRVEAAQPWTLRLAGTLAVLRANLNLHSAAFRHALRLAVCVALSYAIGRALDLRRSYWIPMTVAIVLRPDFGSTFSRGLLRVAGTVVGLVLATALFHAFIPGPIAQALLIGAFMFLLRAFGPANYGVFVTALTALVVLLFASAGVAPGQVIVPRGINTLLGGFIALAAYAAWPTWERANLPALLARLLHSYRDYFDVVRDAYVAPDQSFSAQLDRKRQAARLARSNLEASVVRLRAEPGIATARLPVLERILANSHRLAHAIMSLEAGLVRSRPVPARDAFRAFATNVDQTLATLAATLEGNAHPEALPDLREAYHALTHSGDSTVGRYALVNVEADRITNSLNTLAEEIRQWIA